MRPIELLMVPLLGCLLALYAMSPRVLVEEPNLIQVVGGASCGDDCSTDAFAGCLAVAHQTCLLLKSKCLLNQGTGVGRCCPYSNACLAPGCVVQNGSWCYWTEGNPCPDILDCPL